MRLFPRLVAFVFAGLCLCKASPESEYVASLIAQADRVEITLSNPLANETLSVVDKDWILSVSKAVEKAPLAGKVSCLCTGWRTATFYKAKQMLVSVAAIHGNQLRIYWTNGGGDYAIDEASWKKVKEALKAPKEMPSVPKLPPEQLPLKP